MGVVIDADVAELLGLDAIPAEVDAGWDLGDLHRECEHNPGSLEHSTWMREQADRESFARQVSGRMSDDTAAMKAQMRSDFEGAGYGRPDPTLEVQEAPPNPFTELTTLIGVTAEALGHVASAVVKEIAVAVRSPISGHSVSFTIVDEAWPGTFEARGVEVQRQRLRHGRSSVCPAHGPTKGGLCRRCAR